MEAPLKGWQADWRASSCEGCGGRVASSTRWRAPADRAAETWGAKGKGFLGDGGLGGGGLDR